jgi:hypothetical protein
MLTLGGSLIHPPPKKMVIGISRYVVHEWYSRQYGRDFASKQPFHNGPYACHADHDHANDVRVRLIGICFFATAPRRLLPS